MSDMLMLIFPTRGTLVDAVERLRALDYVNVENTALIAKAEDGEAEVFEDDISPTEGTITGGTLGSLMTALGIAQLGAFLLPGVGPVIAIGAGAIIGALVGGATGGITARLLDFGFRNDQLEALAEQLETGRTALVVEVEHGAAALPRLREDLREFNVEVVQPPQA